MPCIYTGVVAFILLAFAIPHVAIIPAIRKLRSVPYHRKRAVCACTLTIPAVYYTVHSNGLIFVVAWTRRNHGVQIAGDHRLCSRSASVRQFRSTLTRKEPVSRIPLPSIRIINPGVCDIEVGSLHPIVGSIARNPNIHTVFNTVSGSGGNGRGADTLASHGAVLVNGGNIGVARAPRYLGIGRLNRRSCMRGLVNHDGVVFNGYFNARSVNSRLIVEDDAVNVGVLPSVPVAAGLRIVLKASVIADTKSLNLRVVVIGTGKFVIIEL